MLHLYWGIELKGGEKMFQLIDQAAEGAKIKVVGIGGGGGNAVAHMRTQAMDGVQFICVNTDAQALSDITLSEALHIGRETTNGLGAGANPEVGRAAAQESRAAIAEQLAGADMVFITAGMGGGTGTGAAPVVAEVARELGALTVAVVTKPFKFEGKSRMRIADQGISELKEAVDSLIIIPNEKLMSALGSKVTLIKAFAEANNVLKGAVEGISDLITRPGMINVDFADVRTVMTEMGMSMMGTGRALGDERARIATEQAVQSPLLEGVDLKGAKGVLVNVAAGKDLSLGEFSEVGDLVAEYAAEDATIVVGTVVDETLGDEIKVTVVATGLSSTQQSVIPEPVLVVENREPKAKLDINTFELPEILKRTNLEALLDKPEPEDPYADLDYLDVPTYLRR
ncbi:Cell division protein FtsZ [Marinobacterium sp. xm-a-121]|jgi:cell division protein FtsZ|nr:Cell division protein FtsZ [Marinobacterium sp. xm-a-152]NRP27724.1 Cell division protein FtsZ [Marinobacterium sp. xm-d-420]NRP37101.1 Cell division protein FtsZ [Marinobacterium sp. xm-d-579]NRP38304.1 Cell division protein FtsZ [Marinobacterium sp. xm-a-121]NRP53224.1 Cell division protein FtsZ [Marinobacterium sp. xm-v-242]NRP57425.1 Cell division protein FtsZ [Marinobacterium sp. xm-d-510]NRP59941.1 Cell division protein FtsZ [Marinobacterium sp. xm-d-564]NRP78009.1 Cell division pro